MNYKPYIIFSLIVVAGLLVTFLISAGLYPVAFVNGTVVSARQFSREYQATNFYYHRVLDTYSKKALGETELTAVDLEASAMETLVENILFEGGAKREGGADLDYLVENKLSQFRSDSQLEKAASDLYGFNKDEFWNFVLVPQARRDVLAGRLFLKGKKIEDWLMEAKKSAKVFIFSSQFYWNGETVEGKKRQ